MKKKLACNYAVLRFLPYPETGEFVNIGVAIGCPDKGDARQFNQVLLNLLRPREESFCFSPPRTCLTTDPAGTLSELFERYVERGFAKHGESEKAGARILPEEDEAAILEFASQE
jgi:hypothetical protein